MYHKHTSPTFYSRSDTSTSPCLIRYWKLKHNLATMKKNNQYIVRFVQMKSNGAVAVSAAQHLTVM